jgi:hypothetical protein
MKNIILILSLFVYSATYGQSKTKKVLFLGNSYTYVNDLPKMIANIANSTGDSLIYDSNTPGGHSIGNHSLNTTSLSKIMLGKWDNVILQGQSYELATSTPEFSPFPYARKLDSIIHLYNDCAETMFYMTWGRKNGDPSSCPTIPFLCTYEKMDSIIHLNYMRMADSNDAVVSPVGAVWRHIRKNYPLIDLYQSDESHPSLAGTYAAACCFYTALYRKDPTLAPFNPGLSTSDVVAIRKAAKLVVYDSLLHWHIGEYDSLINAKCPTTSIKENRQHLLWSITPNPVTNLLTVRLPNKFDTESIQIYNSMGVLLEELDIVQSAEIDVTHYPNGLYFIRSKNNPHKAYKFVKN